MPLAKHLFSEQRPRLRGMDRSSFQMSKPNAPGMFTEGAWRGSLYRWWRVIIGNPQRAGDGQMGCRPLSPREPNPQTLPSARDRSFTACVRESLYIDPRAASILPEKSWHRARLDWHRGPAGLCREAHIANSQTAVAVVSTARRKASTSSGAACCGARTRSDATSPTNPLAKHIVIREAAHVSRCASSRLN